MGDDLGLVMAVAAVVAFAFSNGFHDTANLLAAPLSTRAFAPRPLIVLASLMCFAGALITLEVAETFVTELVELDELTVSVLFAAAIGATCWSLITWYFGFPSSSTHALIGGLIGATVAAAGTDAIRGDGVLDEFLIPALLAPAAAVAAGLLVTALIYQVVGRRRPGSVNRFFSQAQIGGTALLALALGSNDAQKAMGVIVLALFVNGDLSGGFEVPLWVELVAASALALGVYAGGARIIRKMGARVLDIDSAQGFASQGSSAAVVLACSGMGFPVSSTHVITGGQVGVRSVRGFSPDRWGLFSNVTAAWLITLPASALAGAVAWGLVEVLGGSGGGALVVGLISGAGWLALFRRRRAKGQPVPGS